MWRSVHSWIGLVLSLLVMVTAITGAILATEPVYDRAMAPAGGRGFSVADVLYNVQSANARAVGERLKRQESGAWKLSYSQRNKRRERVVDPATGKFSKEPKKPGVYVLARDLHRSFLLGDKGRILAAVSAIAMAVLCFSGVALMVRRAGGWRYMLAPVSGTGIKALHTAVGRALLVPLAVITVSALYLSALTFDLLSTSTKAPAYAESLKELDPVDPWDLAALKDIQLSTVTEIVYPIPDDWFDVWAVKTHSEWVFVDQYTGQVLSTEPLPASNRIYDFIMLLHTGKNAWPWAIVLLFASLAVPFFAVTGTVIWLRGKSEGGGRIRHNASRAAAQAVILVGSEGGTTWRFAKALHSALVASGVTARVEAMNDLGRYPAMDTLIAMAATYGDGEPPKSATRFSKRLEAFAPQHNIRHMTLAFGDKAFPQYCAFGAQVDAALTAKLGAPVLPVFEIDKQSPDAFAKWCDRVAGALALPLAVTYAPRKLRTRALTLVDKQLFGETAVLRFTGRTIPAHVPGDLVQILPPGALVPRLYSLGSCSKRDGFLEIIVKRVPGGLCSEYLVGLTNGAVVQLAVKQNKAFHLPRRNPVVMIGAGTGLAPYTGMIRHNTGGRAMDLFWGGRNPSVDALYGDELSSWSASGQLDKFAPAWSRSSAPKQYVQDRVRAERSHLVQRLRAGATVMVCGGTAMAAAVRAEFETLAAEAGLSLDELKRRNRYLEDTY